MNFSCPDSKFLLDDQKVLGFCGVLYSETFKALWGRGGQKFQKMVHVVGVNWSTLGGRGAQCLEVLRI